MGDMYWKAVVIIVTEYDLDTGRKSGFGFFNVCMQDTRRLYSNVL